MKRRILGRVLTVLLAVALVGAVIAYLVASDLFVDSFTDLENQDTVTLVDRANYIMQSRVNQLAIQASHWANTTSTIRYVSGQPNTFASIDIGTPDTLVRENVDYIMVFNSTDQLMLGRHVDLHAAHKDFLATPGSVTELLNANSPLLSFSGTETEHSGVVALPEGLLQLSSQAVHSPTTHAVIGTIVLARSLTTADQVSYASSSHITDLRYYQVGATAVAHMTDPSAIHFGKRTVYHKSDEINEGFGEITDIFGKPTIVSRIISSRQVSHLGLQNVRRLMLFLVIIGIICLSIISLWFYFAITQRIRNLVTQLTDAERLQSKNLRVKVTGDDEITMLANAINFMLESVHRAYQVEEKAGALEHKVSDSTQELHDQLNEMKRVNELMVNRELKMKELKAENEALRAQLEGKPAPHGDRPSE